ncbi:DUF6778 family protein [Bradyrhizobium sp.]|uniref:DUF6778 family protein n=1 Tax=Bradyrhizobium sp. TaxID=376 RepID=UPI00403807C6
MRNCFETIKSSFAGQRSISVGIFGGLARLAVLGGALALVGCKTVENSLTANDVSSMRLAGVTVSFTPDARVLWDESVRAYAASKAIPDDEIGKAMDTPEAKAYVRKMLAPRVKASVEQAMAGQLNGARPVRLDIIVKNFALPSAMQRVMVGGAREMTADANLVDAKTGAVIIAYPEMRSFLMAGQGVLGAAVQAAADSAASRAVVDQVTDRYAQDYRNWLLRRAT